MYGLAAVDDRGRVADSTVLRAMDWPPGTRLAIEESGGLLLVTSFLRGCSR